MNLEHLESLQIQLAAKVAIPAAGKGYFPSGNDFIFSFDIQYNQHDAYIALDVQNWSGKQFGIYAAVSKPEMEYMPQFFCFREGPLLLKMLRYVQKLFNLTPSLLIVDGHGTAHPRRFGIACWLGVETGLPAIGCAKETLLRYGGTLKDEPGAHLSVLADGSYAGTVLRTQSGVKPVFVSPGHLVSHQQACEIILHLSPNYRICEPLRRADQTARLAAKGQLEQGFMWLGEI